MSASRIATLLATAATFGVILSVLLGPLAGAAYLLDATLACFVLAGAIMVLHGMIGLWTDLTRSA